jgi:NAD(P)H-hydrate repair Nnr-like enzyme with NAD(P)H-hydrate dehydratase domain
MENTNWFRQANKPLFEDLLWSRPENKRYAGKLLIVGGNLHSLAVPAAAFAAAEKAGIGTARVVLPGAAQKVLGRGFLEAEFAPNTPSGSFSREALAVILENAHWADGVLLAGDFGRNSETAILLESLLDKYTGPLVAAGDAVDYFLGGKSRLLERPNTVSLINLGKLQKLVKNNTPQDVIKHDMNLIDLVNILQKWTDGQNLGVVTRHQASLVAAYGGKVSTTTSEDELAWQIELAAYVATWLIQQPAKPFEAITTAIADWLKLA